MLGRIGRGDGGKSVGERGTSRAEVAVAISQS